MRERGYPLTRCTINSLCKISRFFKTFPKPGASANALRSFYYLFSRHKAMLVFLKQCQEFQGQPKKYRVAFFQKNKPNTILWIVIWIVLKHKKTGKLPVFYNLVLSSLRARFAKPRNRCVDISAPSGFTFRQYIRAIGILSKKQAIKKPRITARFSVFIHLFCRFALRARKEFPRDRCL